MNQKIILIMLALGMFSTSGYAQNREYKVENDGFEWYKISTKESGITLYGALDKQGNSIVPAKYKYIDYDNGIFRVEIDSNSDQKRNGALDIKGNLIIPLEYWFATVRPVEGLSKENSLIWVSTGHHGYDGYYNMFGKCIVPVSRKYRYVYPQKDRFYCYYTEDIYTIGKRSICDASGKVVFETRNDCRDIFLINDTSKGKYVIIKDNRYFVDINDNNSVS